MGCLLSASKAEPIRSINDRLIGYKCFNKSGKNRFAAGVLPLLLNNLLIVECQLNIRYMAMLSPNRKMLRAVAPSTWLSSRPVL